MYLQEGSGLGQMPTQPEVKNRGTWLRLVADLRNLLERRLRADDARGIQERRRRLIQLFESLEARPWDAEELEGRLLFTSDPLGRLFHYRLATPLRNRLLRILRDIVQRARGPI
jgi:hypothetical protein